MAEIKHQIPIDATSAKVYSALTTQAGLQSWWTTDADVEERIGGKAVYGFERRGMVFRMKTEKLEPEKLVVWSCSGDHPEWAGTMLTWTISSEGGKTVLRFTQSGWKSISEFCTECNTSWGELMHRIKGYSEGKTPGPLWKE